VLFRASKVSQNDEDLFRDVAISFCIKRTRLTGLSGRK